MSDWKTGDRVSLTLPVKGARHGTHALVFGTVREVDPAGLPTGVRVDLDRMINGVTDCYASHGELGKVTDE